MKFISWNQIRTFNALWRNTSNDVKLLNEWKTSNLNNIMELSPRMVFQRKISIYICFRFKVFFQVFGKLNACNCSYGSRGQNNHLFVEKTLLTKEGPNLPQYGVARKPITSEVGIQAKKKIGIVFFLISKHKTRTNQTKFWLKNSRDLFPRLNG